MKTSIGRGFFIITMITGMAQGTVAQKQDGSAKDSSTVVLGIDYKSDNVYAGRSDTFRTAYISPSISYYTKSGFYVSGTASYQASESRIDLFELEAGYAFDFHRWNGSAYISRYFYNRNSYNISSEIAGVIGAELKYQNDVITPIFSTFINLARTPDIGCTIGLQKSFYALHDNLEIIPSLNVNAGTQFYFNAYYENRKYAVTRKTKKSSGAITANALGAGEFRMTDIEMAAPLYYSWKKIDLHFIPTLAVPVHANTISVSDKSGGYPTSYTYSEQLHASFYWSAGISYTL